MSGVTTAPLLPVALALLWLATFTPCPSFSRISLGTISSSSRNPFWAIIIRTLAMMLICMERFLFVRELQEVRSPLPVTYHEKPDQQVLGNGPLARAHQRGDSLFLESYPGPIEMAVSREHHGAGGEADDCHPAAEHALRSHRQPRIFEADAARLDHSLQSEKGPGLRAVFGEGGRRDIGPADADEELVAAGAGSGQERVERERESP